MYHHGTKAKSQKTSLILTYCLKYSSLLMQLLSLHYRWHQKKKSSTTLCVLEWGRGGKKRDQGKATTPFLLLLENSTLGTANFLKSSGFTAPHFNAQVCCLNNKVERKAFIPTDLSKLIALKNLA